MKKVWFVAIGLTVLLSGCSLPQDIIDTGFKAYGLGIGEFYDFLHNGNYQTNDISDFHKEDKEISFMLKNEIHYDVHLNNDSSLTSTITAPMNSEFFHDIINISDYALDNEINNPKLESALNKSFQEKKSQSLTLKDEQVTMQIAINVLNKDNLKIIMVTK